jgi:hypothetical protein
VRCRCVRQRPSAARRCLAVHVHGACVAA